VIRTERGGWTVSTGFVFNETRTVIVRSVDNRSKVGKGQTYVQYGYMILANNSDVERIVKYRQETVALPGKLGNHWIEGGAKVCISKNKATIYCERKLVPDQAVEVDWVLQVDVEK
tara:strand:- start:7629 stop:7976 length:348 start_codon:yes stop_codon:yes gene_type:complete